LQGWRNSRSLRFFWVTLLLSLLGLDRQIQAICDIKSRILLKNLVSGPPDLSIRLEPEW